MTAAFSSQLTKKTQTKEKASWPKNKERIKKETGRIILTRRRKYEKQEKSHWRKRMPADEKEIKLVRVTSKVKFTSRTSGFSLFLL